uniref:Acetyl-coenzyme A carboxylase carboxyl transferase subunit beta, chloroplastic n=1 Tax=Avrainvillea sp. HV04061 TaxID=2364086 RepID=A0A3B8CLC5_9CHLO|nr:acetyl-CoA carboxylase, carboxyl transferase subunit beta [Avrainvillea sp. HV04061]
MSILSWIENQTEKKKKSLWIRCEKCGSILYLKHLKANFKICFACGYYLQMDSHERIQSFINLETWQPFDETLSSGDPIDFQYQKSYKERLSEAQRYYKIQDAVVTGTGFLEQIPIALAVMDFNFMGGSMGSVVGEKITRLIEYATKHGLILVIVCASGGARMQEGILSLMQMAKISSALELYQKNTNLLYITIITSPTTGGVTASFAMLGDLIIAEPLALIGFAGRRVIEQTLNEILPDNFQKAESLMQHGLLDLIIPRIFLKQALYEIVNFHQQRPFNIEKFLPKKIKISINFIQEEKNRRFFYEKNKSLKKKFLKTKRFNVKTNSFDLLYKKIFLSLKKFI